MRKLDEKVCQTRVPLKMRCISEWGWRSSVPGKPKLDASIICVLMYLTGKCGLRQSSSERLKFGKFFLGSRDAFFHCRQR